MNSRFLIALFGAGLAAAYWITPAFADEWNKKTILTFDHPVEVPGHVLTPGTYVFELADLSSDRDVVQIFSENKKGMDHLVTTVMAVPTYQMNTPERPEINFEERHSNTPEAVHTWFYPGDNYGWEFVYPKAERLLAANNTPPLAQPVTPAPNQQAAPLSIPKPAAAPVSQRPAATVPAPQPAAQPVTVAQNRAPAPPSAQPAPPRTLPKTASNLPFETGLGGLLMVMGVALLALRRPLHRR
jgi:outer membrane biosynthesis protein TonB